MENQTATTPTKKVRALPRVWARFFRLKAGDTFFTDNEECIKVAFCGYRYTASIRALGEDATPFHFITPWRRVRTTVFVRDVLKGGASADPLNSTIDSVRSLVRVPHTPLKPFRASDYQRGPVTCAEVLKDHAVNSGPSA